MKIEIVWAPDDDIQVAAQKGMSNRTTVIVDGEKYTISFVEFDTVSSVVKTYSESETPFPLVAFFENGCAIQQITNDCILHAIQYLIEQKIIGEFPYLKNSANH